MICHNMSAAFFAVLPLTDFRLLKHRNIFCTGDDPHSDWLPKGEGIDRATRPRSARSTMTISHCFWLARNLQVDCSAEAFAFVCCRHCRLLSLIPYCRKCDR